MVNSNLYNTLFNRVRQRGGGSLTNLLYEKKTFLVKTFANLIVQLGITYYVMKKTKKVNNRLLYIIGSFCIILVLALVPMPSWLKFIVFCILSYIFGLLLSSLALVVSSDIIEMAIQGTMGIFVTMFAIGVALIMSGIKLGIKTAAFLFFSLVILILARIVFWFSGASSSTKKILTFIALILFSAYIVFDTNKILQRDYSGDFITASLDYYLDILNIFVNLVSLEKN